MTRLMFGAVVFLIGSSAFAMPEVGDFVVYQGHFDGAPFTQTRELLSYDPDTDSFMQRVKDQVQGRPEHVIVENTPRDDLFDDATLEYLLANCEEENGTPETVRVPSGEFQTCRVRTDKGGYVNVARVPFGIVRFKSEIQHGIVWSMELVDFGPRQ